MRALLKTLIVLCFGAVLAACSSTTAPPLAASEYAVAGQDVEYTFAPGDKIRVVVFGEETLTGEYIISSGGNLTFPLIGTVKATDQTVEGLQKIITAKLNDGYVNNAQVNIQVLSFRPFYILGEVNRPGEYPVSTGLTLEQAVAAAGGYTYRANVKRAFLKRATESEERLVDVGGDRTVIIKAGDTIRIVERHF